MSLPSFVKRAVASIHPPRRGATDPTPQVAPVAVSSAKQEMLGAGRKHVIAALLGVSVCAALVWLDLPVRVPVLHSLMVPLPGAGRLVVLLLATVCTLAIAPTVASAVLRWSRRRTWLPADSGLLAFGVPAVAWPLITRTSDQDNVPLQSLGAAALVLLAVRFALPAKLRRQQSSPGRRTASSDWSLVDRILRDHPLDAYRALPDDALGRRELADTITTLLSERRSTGLTIGINGRWGAGKTTLLNEVRGRLAFANAIVVTFSAWSFRNPELVVRGYFGEVDRTVRTWAFLPGIRRSLAALQARVISAGKGSKLEPLATAFMPDVGSDDDLMDDLREALGALDRPLIIIVDDLERLDRNELQAALRAIRLLASLPFTAHLLAYDRPRLEEALLGNESSKENDWGQGYLDKLISLEFPLATISSDTRLALLGTALDDVFKEEPDQLDRLTARFADLDSSAIIEALETPRIINRVVVSLALDWCARPGLFDPWDMLILTTIQYRFPRLYRALHTNPNLFARTDWAPGLHIADNNKLQQARVRCLDEAFGHDNAAVQRSLVGLLFPHVLDLPFQVSDAATARASRRIMHPDVFPSYFRLPLEPGRESPEENERFADSLLAADSPTRREIIRRRTSTAAAAGQLTWFWHSWRGWTDRFRGQHNTSVDIVDDLVVGLALAAGDLTGSVHDPFSPMRMATDRAMRLIQTLSTDGEATRVVVDAIRSCTSLAFAGDLVFYTVHPERRESKYGPRVPDGSVVQATFDQEVIRRLDGSGKRLLDSTEEEIVAVFYRTGDSDIVNRICSRELSVDPRLALRGLATVISVRRDALTGELDVLDNQIGGLATRIDLTPFREAILALGTDSINDPVARYRTQYFLDRFPVSKGRQA